MNNILLESGQINRDTLSREMKSQFVEKFKLSITGLAGLLVVMILTLIIYPKCLNYLLIYAVKDYFKLILMGLPAVTIHEIGHYIFGELSGAKVIITSTFLIIIKARIISYNRYQKLFFGIGGPILNIILGSLLLIIRFPQQSCDIICLFSFLNIVIGVGALLPVSEKRGGLKYLMDFIDNRFETV